MKNYQEFEVNENDYLMWCLLNQLLTNDDEINKMKNNLLELLESKLYPNFNNENDIIDSKLFIRFYFDKESSRDK